MREYDYITATGDAIKVYEWDSEQEMLDTASRYEREGNLEVARALRARASKIGISVNDEPWDLNMDLTAYTDPMTVEEFAAKILPPLDVVSEPLPLEPFE